MMHLRTDSMHIAGWKRAIALGALPPRAGHDDACDAEWDAIEPAQPGDCWRLRQVHEGVERFTGYALTCPKADCKEGVHFWDHARACARKFDPTHGSCWTWNGSPEDGTLTASPSLHCVAEWGGCGWHGWLRNGQMEGA